MSNQAPTRTREEQRQAFIREWGGPMAVIDLALYEEHIAEAEARARSEAEAARGGEAVAWRPIETAPKDGTICLIGWASSEWYVRTAWWDAEFDSEWDDEANDAKPIGAWTAGVVASWGDEKTQSYNPTHWMPLPNPPNDGGDTAPPDDSAEKIARLVKALRAADQFITNGIEFGFIRMPDPETNDSASRTPDLIRAALASAPTQGWEG